MRSRRFPCITSIALIASLALAAPALAGSSRASTACNGTVASRVVIVTNAYRASLGLGHLKVVPTLSAFAAAHARDMARNAILTHSSSAGLSFAQRAHASSYRFTTMRENVAVESGPLPAALGPNLWSLWRHSPEHDANMRARDVTQIGVAVVAGRTGCYASMVLASPSS
jgi:uncharacterized protein YkwD